jgi:DNA-binding NtrC family response regulator
MARQRAEVQAVRQSLAVTKGNLSRAAEMLGVTRPTLYDLLERYGIDSSQFTRSTVAAVPAAEPDAGEDPRVKAS